ncbi:MAG: hypothetical protein AAGE84_25360 [Cyanobacteria bacterium P01_G01_bin.39]
MIEPTTKLVQIFFTTSAIAILTPFFCPIKVNAQYLKTDKRNLLITQKLGIIERKVELSEVPPTVLSSARAASGADPVQAQVQINPDGSLVYELMGQNQQGFDFEIEINPNGEIVEIDEQVEASAVPEKVMKAFKYWLPNATVISSWRSTRYKTFDYFYEIVINDDFSVEIPADASTVKISPLSTSSGTEN